MSSLCRLRPICEIAPIKAGGRILSESDLCHSRRPELPRGRSKVPGAHSCLGTCRRQTFTFTSVVANTSLRHPRPPLTASSYHRTPCASHAHFSSNHDRRRDDRCPSQDKDLQGRHGCRLWKEALRSQEGAHTRRLLTIRSITDMRSSVECRRSLGLGHCRRQLRHLPQPHHGLVYACSLSRPVAPNTDIRTRH